MKMMLKDAIEAGATFEEFRRRPETTEEDMRAFYLRKIKSDGEIGVEYECLVDPKSRRIEYIHPYCPNFERTRKLLEARKRRMLGIGEGEEI